MLYLANEKFNRENKGELIDFFKFSQLIRSQEIKKIIKKYIKQHPETNLIPYVEIFSFLEENWKTLGLDFFNKEDFEKLVVEDIDEYDFIGII